MEFHLFAWPLSPHSRHNGACFGACEPHGLAEIGKQTFPFAASPRFDPAAKLWRRGSSSLSPLLAHRGFFVSEMVASQVSPWSACASCRLPGTRTQAAGKTGQSILALMPDVRSYHQPLEACRHRIPTSLHHVLDLPWHLLPSSMARRNRNVVSSRCIRRLWITTS